MALKSRYVQTGDVVDHTPASALTAGDPIQLPDGRAAIPSRDIAAAALGAVVVEGVFEVSAVEVATAFTAGAVVGWDNTAKVAVVGDSVNATFPLGRAIKTSTAGAAVLVALNDARSEDVSADANTAHALSATFSDVEVEAALNALATKVNALINALKDANISA